MLKSPFPGMDPFLERHWTGVHGKLITYISDQLQSRVAGDLRVRTEERVFLEDEAHRRDFYPDVFIVEPREARAEEHSRAASATADVAVAEPCIVRFSEEPLHQRFLEIVDVSQGRRVVTVIELMSPTNKSGRSGCSLYRK